MSGAEERRAERAARRAVAAERHARQLGAQERVLDTHHTLEAAGGLYASSGFVAIEPYNQNSNATRWYGKAL